MTRSEIRASIIIELSLRFDLKTEQVAPIVDVFMERWQDSVASGWKRTLEPFRTKFVFAAALYYVLVDPLEDIQTVARGVNKDADGFRKVVADVRDTLGIIEPRPGGSVEDEW